MLIVLGEVSVSSSGALLLEFLRLSCMCTALVFTCPLALRRQEHHSRTPMSFPRCV